MDREQVKRIRKGLGLSQERFAHRLGVSLQSVRRWEGGLARPLPLITTRLEELARDLEATHSASSGQAQTDERRRPMGEGEQDRRRPEFGPWTGSGQGFGGMFKGIGNLLDLVSRMAEEGQEQSSRSGTFEGRGGDVKGVYGFSVRLGLGGSPVVEEFGNLRETPSGTTVSDTREPLVDILDEGDAVVVIAEMPGVDEQDIRVHVQGRVLSITAATGQRKYHKEVDLPAPTDPGSIASSYRNGVLEVKLAKRQGLGVSNG